MYKYISKTEFVFYRLSQMVIAYLRPFSSKLCILRIILPRCFNRQAALHMLKNPHVFYQYMEGVLDGESYLSYCENLFHGRIWGCDMAASSVGRMFNIAITIVTPFLKNEIQLFHNQETPDVLIVTNGGPVGCERPSTHFSATVSRLLNHKMPGSSLNDEDIFVRICDSYQFAHRLAQNRAIDQERSVFNMFKKT